MYKITGHEQKKVSTQKIDCGEVVTTEYFDSDKLVRVDKTVNVSGEWLALQGLVGE